jgi:hypothetical protein
VFVKLEVGLEINLEVLENQLDVTVVRQEPEVDVLLCIDFPMFNSWELDAKESFIE